MTNAQIIDKVKAAVHETKRTIKKLGKDCVQYVQTADGQHILIQTAGIALWGGSILLANKLNPSKLSVARVVTSAMCLMACNTMHNALMMSNYRDSRDFWRRSAFKKAESE